MAELYHSVRGTFHKIILCQDRVRQQVSATMFLSSPPSSLRTLGGGVLLPPIGGPGARGRRGRGGGLGTVLAGAVGRGLLGGRG